MIDFYHVDSMETINYEPIHRHLPNSALVAVPGGEWFDFERALSYFQERHLDFQTHPSINPDCVITTQYHRGIELPEYKKSLSMRLMYSLTEKNFCHSRKASEPFDAVLVPGEYSKKIISKYTNAIVIGFPKYDDFLKGLYRKADLQKDFKLDKNKKTILYLPTWSICSSLDYYHREIKKLINLNKYNFIFKPHTITVRKEQSRINYFHKEIGEGKILYIEKQIGLDKLFAVSDIVIADGMSGAFWESFIIANLPTLALYTEGNFHKKNLETKVQEFSVVNNEPVSLIKDLERVEREGVKFKEERKVLANELVSFRDGTAGKKAADEILNFIESRKRERKVFDFIAIYPHVYISRIGRFFRYYYTRFKKSLRETFPILDAGVNYGRRYHRKLAYQHRFIKYSDHYERAIAWLKNNRVKEGGVIISSNQRISYQEVTGYTIPTLYQWGEKELARELARWLMRQQNEDGSFSAPDRTPYTFDTGQVIRGLLSGLDDIPEVEKILRKACDWLLTQVQSDGRLSTPAGKVWGSIADDRIHLYVLPPLIEAGKRFNEPRYIDAATRVLEYYKHRKGLIEFNTLSHYYAYIIEALCDLGEIDLASEGMKEVAALQRENGSIPAYKDVSWICSTGVAQFAVIGYKVGLREFADKAVNYLEKIQNRTGAFYGSYGKGANYFPKEEISWAVKFFLDDYFWKIRTSFNKKSNAFSESIEEKDGRVQEVLVFLGDLNGKEVIDIGCGKGRFIKILKRRFPNSHLYGLDISQEMLSFCPDAIETLCGNILDIRYPNAYFDCVYCVEVLEHALRTERAIKEMVRILKPGGKIIIIDKNISKLGVSKLEPWEQWFKPKELIDILNKYGVKANYKPIAYGKYFQADGLIIAWEGIKYA